jgi:signal transduction histidine kinase
MQMSDTASVHAGQLVLRMSHEDVGRLVREACDLADTIAATRSMRLRRSLPDSPLPAQCDAQRIFSVLENLLTNAIKFTPDGGTITVSAGLSGANVVVAVEDDGPGIRDDEPGELFQPYRRGQGTTAGLPPMPASPRLIHGSPGVDVDIFWRHRIDG